MENQLKFSILTSEINMAVKNKIIFLILGIFLIVIPGISAICESGQIDINTASLEELDELWGIGPVKAQAIIDTRPFNSLDDLMNVNGIGEVTLNNIKSQGLACVVGENSGGSNSPPLQIQNETENNKVNLTYDDTSSNEKENLSTEINQPTDNPDDSQETNNNKKIVEETKIDKEAIVLDPKDIKGEESKEKSNKNRYITYGLIGFSVLLSILFLLKKRPRKNEFKE